MGSRWFGVKLAKPHCIVRDVRACRHSQVEQATNYALILCSKVGIWDIRKRIGEVSDSRRKRCGDGFTVG
jgi:hypothetical protein